MSQPLRALIVEDSEDDTALLVRELRRRGYEITFQRVETGEGLKAALQEQIWDVILSDYNLPGFNAQAALAVLQESGLDLPFIVVSGKIGEETATALMRAVAHDYIMKNNLTRLAPAIEREIKEAEVRRERKRAEEDLRASEEKYRALVENANEAILIVQDGVIKFANPTMEKLLEYSRAELAEIPFARHIHPDDRETVLDRHHKRLQGENPAAPYSFRVRNKSGKEL